MNTDIIQGTLRLWQAEPEKAKLKPLLTARSEGSQAVLEYATFSWKTDLPLMIGGGNEAPPPTALFLGSLAGCVVTFIRAILAPQLGVQVDEVRVSVCCEYDALALFGVDGSPPEFQNLQLKIQIYSSDSAENVQKLYQAWSERCPIYLALVNPTLVDITLEINPS